MKYNFHPEAENELLYAIDYYDDCCLVLEPISASKYTLL